MIEGLVIAAVFMISLLFSFQTDGTGISIKSLCRFDSVTGICWIDKKENQSVVPSEMDGYFCQNEADFMKMVQKLKSAQYQK